jgi:hypothetical protein
VLFTFAFRQAVVPLEQREHSLLSLAKLCSSDELGVNCIPTYRYCDLAVVLALEQGVNRVQSKVVSAHFQKVCNALVKIEDLAKKAKFNKGYARGK